MFNKSVNIFFFFTENFPQTRNKLKESFAIFHLAFAFDALGSFFSDFIDSFISFDMILEHEVASNDDSGSAFSCVAMYKDSFFFMFDLVNHFFDNVEHEIQAVRHIHVFPATELDVDALRRKQRRRVRVPRKNVQRVGAAVRVLARALKVDDHADVVLLERVNQVELFYQYVARPLTRVYRVVY